MAEKLLDGAQIGTAIEEVACEGVAQDVRADTVWCETGCDGEFL